MKTGDCTVYYSVSVWAASHSPFREKTNLLNLNRLEHRERERSREEREREERERER